MTNRMIPGTQLFGLPSENEFDVMSTVQAVQVRKYRFGWADLEATADTFTIPVNGGELILGVLCHVEEEFDTAADVLVGDPDDDDSFVETGALDPTTEGLVIDSKVQGGAAANGWIPAAGSAIVLTFDDDPVETGIMTVLVFVISLNDSWRKVADDAL
jgi:hypothetical protein